MLPGAISNPIGCLVCAAGVAHLYSHVSKPLLDASLITFSLFRLSRAQQSNASAGIFSNEQVTFVLLCDMKNTNTCTNKMTGASKDCPYNDSGVQVYFANFVSPINMNLFNILLIKANIDVNTSFILSKKVIDSNKSSFLCSLFKV
jgi:hypothetical protein